MHCVRLAFNSILADRHRSLLKSKVKMNLTDACLFLCITNSICKLKVLPLLRGSLEVDKEQCAQMRAELWSQRQHVGQPPAEPE